MAEETVTADPGDVSTGNNMPLGTGAAEIVLRQCLGLVIQDAIGLADAYYDDNRTSPTNSSAAEADADTNYAAASVMDLVCDEAGLALARGLALVDMERRWWRIASVVTAVRSMYPDNGSTASNMTGALNRKMNILPELWMYVADGDKDAEISTAAPSARALSGIPAQQ